MEILLSSLGLHFLLVLLQLSLHLLYAGLKSVHSSRFGLQLLLFLFELFLELDFDLIFNNKGLLLLPFGFFVDLPLNIFNYFQVVYLEMINFYFSFPHGILDVLILVLELNYVVFALNQ